MQKYSGFFLTWMHPKMHLLILAVIYLCLSYRLFRFSIMSFVNTDSLTSYFLIFIPFISFSCLIHWPGPPTRYWIEVMRADILAKFSVLENSISCFTSDYDSCYRYIYIYIYPYTNMYICNRYTYAIYQSPFINFGNFPTILNLLRDFILYGCRLCQIFFPWIYWGSYAFSPLFCWGAGLHILVFKC